MASTVNLLVGPIAVVRVFNIVAFTVFAASVWLKEKHSRHSWCLQRLKKQEGHLTASSKHQSTGGNDVYTEELVYRRGSGWDPPLP